jgi:hypothetical protein
MFSRIFIMLISLIVDLLDNYYGAVAAKNEPPDDRQTVRDRYKHHPALAEAVLKSGYPSGLREPGANRWPRRNRRDRRVEIRKT